MKNTVYEIKKELEDYYSLHWLVRLFSFGRKEKILRLMQTRFNFNENLTYGMSVPSNVNDFEKELAEKYRQLWLSAEKRLDEVRQKEFYEAK